MTSNYEKISPAALIALKDALTHIYWTKNDLRKFVEYTIENKAIVSTIDWQGNVKFESVSQLIDRMATRLDIYKDDLLRLFREVASFSDFSHLKKWDDLFAVLDSRITLPDLLYRKRRHASRTGEIYLKVNNILC